MRRLVVLLALVLAAPAASATPRVRTLLVANGKITAFAQEGRFVGWATTEPGRCRATVRVRDLTRRYQDTFAGDTCRHGGPVYGLALALDLGGVRRNARALWYRFETGNNSYWTLSTASLAKPNERRVAEHVFSNVDEGAVTGLFGDGSTLGYGWYEAVQTVDCALVTTCTYTLRGGAVVRVGDSVDTPQRRLPVPALVAASSGRVAILVRGRIGEEVAPLRDLREIEVRSASTGALIGRITTGGRVRAIALTRRIVAVLTDTAIERYLHRGDELAVDRVPPGATALAAGQYGVVYRVGNSIRAVGHTSELARAASTPIGLSVEGRRVAWAENARVNGRLRGRVRYVLL